ncbi:S41 family peptidase [Neolewinella persica]|uniref:S41 family peptidase n=1 Tax=Neolewinella persica TaxID=70998 RepID=UPI0003AAC1F4|nr:S41 family peptidase [Neolewinella persica]
MLRSLLFLLLPLGLQAQPRTDKPCEIIPPACNCGGEISAALDALKKNKAFQRRDEEEFANHLKRVNTELAADPDGNLNCSFYLGYLLYGIRDGHAYARPAEPKYLCIRGTEAYEKAIRSSEYFKRTPRFQGTLTALRKALSVGEDEITGVFYSGAGIPFGLLPTERKGEYAAYVLADSLKSWDAGQEYFRLFAMPGAYAAFMRDDMHRPYFYRGKSLAGLLRTFGLTREEGKGGYRRPGKELISGKVVSLKPGVGYLYIESFEGSNSNVNMLNAGYDSLRLQLRSLKHLVIDVRSNGGGGARAFKKLLKVLGGYSYPLQLHLLVNEETASAAELFTLEMKKLGAKVYGEPTRGAVAYGYANKGETPAFFTPCGKYRIQLTERSNKPKSLLRFEYEGIPADVQLSHEQDWLEQLLAYIY